MSKSPKQILSKEFSAKSYRRMSEEENIYEYIVHEAAESQMRKFSEHLQAELQQYVTPIIQEILAPQLEVRHVREEGLRIWGKADNVAFSKSTIVELLEMLWLPNDPKKYADAIFLAGRQSAIGFFDQFRRIMRVGDETRLPSSVIKFLQALGEFDERSGWWTMIDYDDSLPDKVSITISKPFWRFPFTRKDNHFFSDFVAGYILSLHNACYDYLSTVSQVTDWKFNDWFAVEVKIFRDPDLDKCHLQLRRVNKTVAEFEYIDALFCVLVEWLLDDTTTDKHREEIINMLYQVDDEIKRVFDVDAQLDKARLDEFKVNQHQFRPEYVRNEFSNILQQIRCRYEDLRIAKLDS